MNCTAMAEPGKRPRCTVHRSRPGLHPQELNQADRRVMGLLPPPAWPPRPWEEDGASDA
jgi:hypothetical protein